jgi:hypothetical protein
LLEREYKGLEIQYKLADVKDKFIKNILNLIGNQ